MTEDIEFTTIDDIATGPLPGPLIKRLVDMKELYIIPYDDDSLRNICYYLHFNDRFRVPRPGDQPINLSSKESIDDAFEPYKEYTSYVLHPGKSVIGQTYEQLGLSSWLRAKLENTTQLGRVLINQASHGYIHPGHGYLDPFRLMLELTNLGERPITITPARTEHGRVIGPEAMRLYIEKLPYWAGPYEQGSFIPKLRMDEKDTS